MSESADSHSVQSLIQDAGWGGGQHLMTRPLSIDLRERVVSAVLAGESCRTVALRFGVAVSSVVKWSQRYRATGSVAPGKVGGHRKSVLAPHRDYILERIAQSPHLTLHGLKAELAARGIKVSHNAVWRFLRREGLRFKKNSTRPRAGPR
jgi:transposase